MQPPSPHSSLEQDAGKLAVTLERYRYVVLSVLTLVYALGVVRQAANKPLWYDELITLVASSAPDAASVWKTAQATDASPPLPHLLTHFSTQWFGLSEVAIRLPAMTGFWIFCLCLFSFVGRRAGIYFGFIALLLPVATEAYAYAFEARAYGLELAFCGLLLVGWQMAGDGRKRLIGCVLVALSLAGAMLCHYYAVLLYGPLAGAELYRTWRERRWNWGLWVAFACGIAPMVWRMATVRFIVNQFSQTTWAPASPEQVLEFWETMLQHSLAFVVLGLAILAWRLIDEQPGEERGTPPKLPAQELVAGLLFLAIPVVAVAIGILKTHMFTPRYALIGLTGVLLLIPLVGALLANGRVLVGFFAMTVAVLPLGFSLVEAPRYRDPFASESILVKALEQGPVVIPDGQLFLQMWHYAPQRLKSRLVFLVDTRAAVEYMGFDALDVGINSLKPWSALPAVDYKDFATAGREFLVYQNVLRPGWVLSKVVHDGASAQIEQHAIYRQLVRVRLRG